MQDNIMRLRDGRTLGYAEYGDPGSTPLVLCHGTPGCRILNLLEHVSWIERFGIRVIIPDRPGYGLSDPQPRRTISDWASDVEELTDHLGLGRFHVAGGSGGGAYALACALHSPSRVLSATLFCSGGPPKAMRLTKDMILENRIVFFLARYVPVLLKGLMALQGRGARKLRARPEVARKRMDSPRVKKHKAKLLAKLPEWDQHVSAQIRKDIPADDAIKAGLEPYRQGGDGAYRDILLLARRWGLDLDQIAVPVYLWHGIADVLVPVATAHALAALIPGCEGHFIPDAGHQLLGSDALCAQMIGRMLGADASVDAPRSRGAASTGGTGTSRPCTA